MVELIPLAVPEVRWLLCRLLWQRRQGVDLTVKWSRWRRRHQALALQCHYSSNSQQHLAIKMRLS